MVDLLSIANPKLSGKAAAEWEGLFPYYAGFSPAFAESVLNQIRGDQPNIVFDPWNGAGTTTLTAAKVGLRSIGSDLNPVMAVVARARAVQISDADILLPLADLLCQASTKESVPDADPLLKWLTRDAAGVVRSLSKAINQHTAGGLKKLGLAEATADQFSFPTATMYVALFSACRQLTKSLKSSNPTWLRQPKRDAEKVSFTEMELKYLFLQAVESATRHAFDHGLSVNNPLPILLTKDAAKSRKNSADVILTSPPYCTRIDYAETTKLELSILNDNIDLYGKFRRSLTGTTLTTGLSHRRSSNLGARCNTFLDSVKGHSSRASSGYYYNSHVDYYNKMRRSVGAICNSLRVGGLAVLVVQDSWYKDVHNDVSEILKDFFLDGNCNLIGRRDFPVKRSLADVHKHRKEYKDNRPVSETVLVFKKLGAQIDGYQP